MAKDMFSAGQIQKGSLLLGTYRVLSDPLEGGEEKQKALFMEECRLWSGLDLHPNIVSCYYVRELDGIPAVFSEWMENGNLEEHILDGSLYHGTDAENLERLLDIAIQFARGLCHVHAAGLLHGDVSPRNLLLTAGWEAKVSDFGLSRARARIAALDRKIPSTTAP